MTKAEVAATIQKWDAEKDTTPAASMLAVLIVKALLETNTMWPHPYDPSDAACEVVRQVLLKASNKS